MPSQIRSNRAFSFLVKYCLIMLLLSATCGQTQVECLGLIFLRVSTSYGMITSKKQLKIYTLSEPDRSWLVRYVGSTSSVKSRYNNHRSTQDNYPVCQWNQKLRREGTKPIMRVLEVVDASEAEKVEQIWIEFFSLFRPLLNRRKARLHHRYKT
jgi:hypothetical protein